MVLLRKGEYEVHFAGIVWNCKLMRKVGNWKAFPIFVACKQ